MEFKFDPNQDFQLEAIQAVSGLFEGQIRQSLHLSFALGGIPAVPNQLNLNNDEILDNLKTVQAENGIRPDEQLYPLQETISTAEGREPIQFLNFSVEMETGTGKTYVYLRTALELFQQYGFRKFIIVVPSIAIREGVLKTFQLTRKHFAALYDNTPYRFYAYNSDNLSQVRQFALSDSVEFMVMTLAAFNKADQNVIHQSTDRLQGETPVHLVQAARPILILDEPQNMESEKSIAALAALRPLFALRYSATHRVPYNIVYRLTPADAYRLRLVKRIEVNAVTQEDDINKPYIRLISTAAKKRTLTARLTIHKLQKSGQIKEVSVTVRPGDSLQEKSGGRPIYAPYAIDEINDGFGFVRFSNTEEISLGQEIGGDKAALFEGQIITTLQEHFRKQALLKRFGIKVLSLFFIDRVDNYAPQEGEGIIRNLFDKAFDQFKQNDSYWGDFDSAEVQAAYFAQRTTRDSQVIYLDTKTGRSQRDREAYELIMRDKERLLSFDEPVAFIFSHSALREGWDNPNVFQICTLNQTISETRKRQEVGRGVRLAVDQEGNRINDERLNVLTVIANESYEQFVSQYQAEIQEEFYAEIAARYGRSIHQLSAEERKQVEQEYGFILPPPPANANERARPKLRKEYTLKPEFKDLWERIKHKTQYNVTVDTQRLIDAVVKDLHQVTIQPPRVAVTKAKVDLDMVGTFHAWQMSAAKTLVNLVDRYPLPNLLDTMTSLMAHTSPPMRLTRKTLLEIIRRAPNHQAIIDNPNEFAAQAVTIIKRRLADQLVDGIQYKKIDEWYQMSLFDEELKTWRKYIEPADRCLYTEVIVDSEVERQFVRDLEHRDDVKLYIKLPDWFTVPTPIGNYNPDWAIVLEVPDKGEQLHLIAETKGGLDNLRTNENRKIACGRAHFEGALGVGYQVGESAAALLQPGLFSSS